MNIGINSIDFVLNKYNKRSSLLIIKTYKKLVVPNLFNKSVFGKYIEVNYSETSYIMTQLYMETLGYFQTQAVLNGL